ncbi:hypothetical protein [Olivibacter sp. XZL3]|uniref:hypothetical protein n=1 Tax=Olivibacter sp. XZL3 TaxID=1735116 RepID=UPI001066E02D|nr:hypothetical protein [Olivibacter sp. XZL3]
MEQTLTHHLLKQLHESDFTILFAAGQNLQQPCIFVPINVDIEDFREIVALPEYQGDAFLIIEEALQLNKQKLTKHSVITE